MLLLISDANILIDIEIGGLAASTFSLEYQFAVPDVLYYQALEERHRLYFLDEDHTSILGFVAVCHAAN